MMVDACTNLNELLRGEKKDGNAFFSGAFIGEAALVIEGVVKRCDFIGEYRAGAEGAVLVNEFCR